MRAATLLLAGTLAACVTAPRATLPEPLPPLPVDEVVSTPVETRAAEVPRITFTASNAPIREMLPLIAQAAGVTLVLDPAVTGRVSFHFEDVPALEALESVARSAGYDLRLQALGPALPFVPRTVFFRPAVNVNALSVDAIRGHFGVGREVAEWVVLSRPDAGRR